MAMATKVRVDGAIDLSHSAGTDGGADFIRVDRMRVASAIGSGLASTVPLLACQPGHLWNRTRITFGPSSRPPGSARL